MKTNLKDKKILCSILGLPNGGTTIINSLVNSLEDGFSLGEPHWLYQYRNKDISLVKQGSCGKVSKYFDLTKVKTDVDILPHFIVPTLNNTDYKVGSYKETYRDGHLKYCDELFKAHYETLDFILLVVREPRFVFRGDIIRNIQDLPKFYQIFYNFSQREKVLPIIYEDFCQQPLKTFNQVVSPYFQIEGEIQLQNPNHMFGNSKSHSSKKVRPANMYKHVEIDESLYKKALSLYNQMRNNE
jgi:hypothetical protein